jgi:hypothetical protein
MNLCNLGRYNTDACGDGNQWRLMSPQGGHRVCARLSTCWLGRSLMGRGVQEGAQAGGGSSFHGAPVRSDGPGWLRGHQWASALENALGILALAGVRRSRRPGRLPTRAKIRRWLEGWKYQEPDTPSAMLGQRTSGGARIDSMTSSLSCLRPVQDPTRRWTGHHATGRRKTNRHPPALAREVTHVYPTLVRARKPRIFHENTRKWSFGKLGGFTAIG